MKSINRVRICVGALVGAMVAGCGSPDMGAGSGGVYTGPSSHTVTPTLRPPGVQLLSGHLTPALAKARPFGRLSRSTRLTVSVGLPVRDQEALTRAVQAVSDPTSPSYRQYLSPVEFADQHGASPADYQKVVEWARSRNLEVTPQDGRIMVQVSGAVEDLETAVHVDVNNALRPDGSPFFGPDREPSLDLDIPIEHIGGLDNFNQPRSALGGSGPSGAAWGNDFRKAYASCTSLTGAGQSIGLLALGAGVLASDITAYQVQSGLPQVHPMVTIGPAGSGGDFEDTLDAEMALSMAPGAQVVAFRGSVNQALMAMTQHPEVSQVSSSYFAFLDSTGRNLVAQLALQGQSFFQASGDNGAYNESALGGLTNDLRDQPAVTVVGGTDLTMTPPGASYVSETTWPSSGGGIASTTVNGDGVRTGIPSYQVGLATAANQASTVFRNLPDVSLVATNIGTIVSGRFLGLGGTSAAAPLWAGFMALINQQGKSNDLASVGFANPVLYLIAKSPSYATSFHDITTGSNPTSTPGSFVTFSATAGYDLATGLGTPSCGLIGTLANARSSGAAPGSTVFRSMFHLAYIANNGSRTLLHSSSTDGINWGPESPVTGQSSAAAPALVSFGGLLHMFFIANDASGQLWHVTSPDGVNWGAAAPVGNHSSKTALAAVVFNGQIHLSYLANNSSNTLLHLSSGDGINWGTETPVANHASKATPALAVLNGVLHMAYISNNSSNALLHISSSDGVSWSTETQIAGHSSNAGPALGVLNDVLHMVYISNNSTNTLLHISSSDGVSWGSETPVGNHSSKSSPTIQGFNGALRMSYLSNNSSNLLLRISSVNGVDWGTETVW